MTGCTAKAARVGGDNVISGFGERRNDLAPGVGDFGEAVEEEDEGSISGGGVVGFKNVDREGIVGGEQGDGSRIYDGIHGLYLFRGREGECNGDV